MRRFFWPQLAQTGETIELGSETSHHALRVCGLAPGEELALFDGKGGAVLCRLVSGLSGVARVEVVAPMTGRDASRPVWLLQGLLRGPAFDTVVRMATEIGVADIWPIATRRSVALGDRTDRWTRIARSAAGQSGRTMSPNIEAPTELETALERLPAGLSKRICVPGAPPLAPEPGPTAILLGPEGGWTEEEVDTATQAGFRLTGLGPNVLRAETAAAVALAQVLSMGA